MADGEQIGPPPDAAAPGARGNVQINPAAAAQNLPQPDGHAKVPMQKLRLGQSDKLRRVGGADVHQVPPDDAAPHHQTGDGAGRPGHPLLAVNRHHLPLRLLHTVTSGLGLKILCIISFSSPPLLLRVNIL